MTSEKIRKLFLNFFKGKEHIIIPSASLLPENDPSVLFTTAGMHPLVPYLLGEVHPGGKRLASVQKCIRTDDIDEVGDGVHLTFFEMLGNWSLGDYWKKEAIGWSLEFLNEKLNLSKDKLAVSCFAGDSDAPKDEESAAIWLSLGIPKNHLYFFGKKDNWWGPAGETGPCGPDTEMFYWAGQGEPRPLTTSDNKEGWVEIWNDVFMQYFKNAEGKFEPLKQKNVDTGMGLERTVSVINKEDMFLIDTFKPLIRHIEGLSGRKYEESRETKRAMRIIADHIRAATFILGDEQGISPSNVGQGYVLRRLIRRAVRYAKLIGIAKSFTVPIAEETVRIFKEVYPELLKNQNKIFAELTAEEEKFAVALEKGIAALKRIFNRAIGGVDPENLPEGMVIKGNKLRVKGRDIFNIYQSYGLPLELSQEIMSGWGIEFDEQTMKEAVNEFQAAYKKHQELSRTASAGQFKGGLADHSEQVVKLHTASHLLHQALIDVLGGGAEQRGSNITVERLRFDFTCPRKLTPEEIKRVEDIVNEKIKEDLPVHFELLTVDEARSRGALGVFEEKYAKMDKVKVYFIGDYSKEICGGPHVSHTGEIGKFKIIKEEASAAGIRRLRAIVE